MFSVCDFVVVLVSAVLAARVVRVDVGIILIVVDVVGVVVGAVVVLVLVDVVVAVDVAIVVIDVVVAVVVFCCFVVLLMLFLCRRLVASKLTSSPDLQKITSVPRARAFRL